MKNKFYIILLIAVAFVAVTLTSAWAGGVSYRPGTTSPGVSKSVGNKNFISSMKMKTNIGKRSVGTSSLNSNKTFKNFLNLKSRNSHLARKSFIGKRYFRSSKPGSKRRPGSSSLVKASRDSSRGSIWGPAKFRARNRSDYYKNSKKATRSSSYKNVTSKSANWTVLNYNK